MGLCVAYGCNTESGVHRISMFTFPKDPKRRKLWIDRLNRGQSATKTFAPNSHSKLCIKHFDENQFIIHPTFAEQIGYGGVRRVRLKPDAVPTIFEKPKKAAPKERPSAAAILGKKKRQEIIGGLKAESSSYTAMETDETFENSGPFTAIQLLPYDGFTTAAITTSIVTTSVVTTNAMTTTDTCHTVQSTAGCPLSWFADLTATVPKLPTLTSSDTSTNSFSSASGSQKAKDQRPDQTQYCHYSTQTPYNLVKRRSMTVQCGVKTAEMGTQTKRLLNLPSLSNRPDDELNESLMSDPALCPFECKASKRKICRRVF